MRIAFRPRWETVLRAKQKLSPTALSICNVSMLESTVASANAARNRGNRTKREQLATSQAAFRRRRSVEWKREVARCQAGRILARSLSHHSRRRDLAHQWAKLEAMT
jgi:hypothetical protein